MRTIIRFFANRRDGPHPDDPACCVWRTDGILLVMVTTSGFRQAFIAIPSTIRNLAAGYTIRCMVHRGLHAANQQGYHLSSKVYCWCIYTLYLIMTLWAKTGSLTAVSDDGGIVDHIPRFHHVIFVYIQFIQLSSSLQW